MEERLYKLLTPSAGRTAMLASWPVIALHLASAAVLNGCCSTLDAGLREALSFQPENFSLNGPFGAKRTLWGLCMTPGVFECLFMLTLGFPCSLGVWLLRIFTSHSGIWRKSGHTLKQTLLFGPGLIHCIRSFHLSFPSHCLW